jgi:hypothetical protein
MAQTATGKSNFFVRSNYAVGARAEVHRATVRQEQTFKAATQALLVLVEQAIARIEQGDEAEAGLRALWASLLELKAFCGRDPGIRMAAQDLYEAAAALVIDRGAGAAVVDIRRWRLLKKADWRLRRRLDERTR